MCNDVGTTTNGATASKANNIKHKENGEKTASQIKFGGDANNGMDIDTVDSGPPLTTAKDVNQFVPAAGVQVPVRVNKNDRNKFSGSLPNNLDTDDVCEENGMAHFNRLP